MCIRDSAEPALSSSPLLHHLAPLHLQPHRRSLRSRTTPAYIVRCTWIWRVLPQPRRQRCRAALDAWTAAHLRSSTTGCASRHASEPPTNVLRRLAAAMLDHCICSRVGTGCWSCVGIGADASAYLDELTAASHVDDPAADASPAATPARRAALMQCQCRRRERWRVLRLQRSLRHHHHHHHCLLYTSPSPRDRQKSRMPSSA